jgi:Fic family protein
MRYIHAKSGWPSFQWSADALSGALAAVRHHQGMLLGRMSALGLELRSQAALTVLTSDVVQSSAIEGEMLPPQEVRSSIARRLGLDAAGLPPATREVDGVVEMMLDATQRYAEPLTRDRLFAWHAALFPTGRSGLTRITVGAWRTPEAGPMRVVSGPVGREKVHFEAPDAARIESEMAAFLRWVNGDASIDPVLRAAIAHLWFVTIHPFDDGNGRIARAITDMALARADGSQERFFSMSTRMQIERKAYYEQLESAQRGGLDITKWLVWFLGCLHRAVGDATITLSAVMLKAQLWQRINACPTNPRQRDVLKRMMDDFEGFLTNSKYAKLAKCSGDSALRDINELLGWGLLLRNAGGGRSTSYRLALTDSRELGR